MSWHLRAIGGAWATAGGVAAFKAYRRSSAFEASTPCFGAALERLQASPDVRALLGDGDFQVSRWGSKLRTDEAIGLCNARFGVSCGANSAQVLMASRRLRPQSGGEAAALQAEEEEEAAARRGFGYYLFRPWELKFAFMDSVRSLAGRSPPVEQNSLKEALPWELDALVVLPRGPLQQPLLLLGDPRGLPDYEALYVRSDAEIKGESSTRRLQIALSVALAGAGVAALFRVMRSIAVTRSYDYMRRFVLQNSRVVAALGPGASISTSSGTFRTTYVNARLRLVGSGGAVGDVEFAATRTAAGAPWRVAMARLNHDGRVVNFDKL